MEIYQKESFRGVTQDTIITTPGSNIPEYFKDIKPLVFNTIKEFKGKDVIKFKLIISCEFQTPLPFDIIEAHYNMKYEDLLSLNMFDTIYKEIPEKFTTWLNFHNQIATLRELYQKSDLSF